ncbi:MAG: dihydrodipicolinate synthase family protein [Acidobacteriota bacterium]|nr:dihydrodipicolinate synthase family protein [Acidobacteriota bacterium]
MLPRGAYAPVPTPLDGRLEFDPTALQSHLAWLSSQGLDGALILGTNGEFPSLSLSERLRVAESASAANSDLRLMLGVGSCSLVEVLEMVGAAAALGYQSVLCPPPFYFRGAPVAGFAAFFREVLDHAEIPVLLYHIPQVTGVPISEELLEAIDGHPRLAGVKDSSGDPAELVRLSNRFAERVYMVGSDRLVTACSRAGGRGSISAAASVAPALVGQADRGQEEQRQLDSVRSLLEDYGLGPAVKTILRRCGVGEYATRPPLLGLDPSRADELWPAFCEMVPHGKRPRGGDTGARFKQE